MKPLLIILALAALPGLAAAQSTPRQGALGVGSSEGTIGLSLNIPETRSIQGNGLGDITFGINKGVTPRERLETFCVYMDDVGTYRATLTSNAFTALGRTAVPVKIGVYSFGTTGSVQGIDKVFVDAAPSSITLGGNPPSTQQNCPRSDVAWIEVTFPNAPTQSGTFTTTITVLVEPE